MDFLRFHSSAQRRHTAHGLFHKHSSPFVIKLGDIASAWSWAKSIFATWPLCAGFSFNVRQLKRHFWHVKATKRLISFKRIVFYARFLCFGIELRGSHATMMRLFNRVRRVCIVAFEFILFAFQLLWNFADSDRVLAGVISFGLAGRKGATFKVTPLRHTGPMVDFIERLQVIRVCSLYARNLLLILPETTNAVLFLFAFHQRHSWYLEEANWLTQTSLVITCFRTFCERGHFYCVGMTRCWADSRLIKRGDFISNPNHRNGVRT